MNRLATIPLIVLHLLAAGCKSSGESSGLPPARTADTPLPALPDTTPASQEAKTPDVSDKTTGTTYPIERAEVGPKTSGIIASVAVDEGDAVKKGQTLFRLSGSDLALRVKQAEAGLQSAKVNLSAVRTEHDRTKRLFDERAIDQAKWDRAQSELRAAQVAVDQAKVSVSLAKQALGDTVVRSPLTGVVTAKLKSPGEAVSTMPPTTVVVVEDHSKLELRFRLPETALKSIQVGGAVSAHFGAIDRQVKASVTRISPNVDPGTRTVEVVCVLDNKDGTLRAGMLATVDTKKKEETAPKEPSPKGEAESKGSPK